MGGEVIEQALDKVREIVRSRGKLLAIHHMGKRRLCYNILKQNRGIYVRAHFLGQHDLVAELERNLRIMDSMIRYLTIRLARNVDPNSREEHAYQAPSYYENDEVEEHGFGAFEDDENGSEHEKDKADVLENELDEEDIDDNAAGDDTEEE
jgi:small subunit ribosomal protein S6